MPNKKSDYVFHPPCGSNVPGKEDPNPYINYSPYDLKVMVEKGGDPVELEKMVSALKQWERIYVYPGYPYRAAARRVIGSYRKKSEISNPAINLPYYQDSETPQGLDEIIDSLRGLHDNEDMERFDYNRQGERPVVDVEFNQGDFSGPNDPPIGDTVKDKGDGPDPDGMENPDPPTGGDIDRL